MTRKGNIDWEDALAAMREANPASARRLRTELDEATLLRTMAGAMMSDRALSPPAPADSRRRLAFAFSGGLACVAAIAALVLLGGGSVGGGSHPAFAAAAVEVAEANPRLLVTAPGWAVTDAGEFEADEGEVTFGDGEHRFTVHWYPARSYRTYLRDRAMVSRPERSLMFGRRATTVHYGLTKQGDEYATMLAPKGPVFVEVRGGLESRAEYDEILHSLREVDVDTWLAAMPRSVVGPENRARVVERMLRGVPLPPDFDLIALQGEDSVLNHYQLAAKVAGTVSCGWFESWLAATDAGDGARARKAVKAMATWRRWPMIPLIGNGGWAVNVKMAAEELATGNIDRGPAGRVVNPDGSGYELGPSWAVWLNCTDRIWRRPFKP